MQTSKEQFKQVLADVAEFKKLGQEWCDNGDVTACAKSRSYSKRIIKSLRAYVETSIKETSNVKPTPPTPVETAVPEDTPVEN